MSVRRTLFALLVLVMPLQAFAQTDDELTTLQQAIAADSVELAALAARLQQLETGELKSLQDEIDGMHQKLQALGMECERNQKAIDERPKRDTPAGQFFETVNRLQTNIDQLGVLSDKALGEIDLDKMRETISLFEGSGALLQSIDEAQYKAFLSSVEGMNVLLPAIQLVHQAQDLMAGRFDEKANQACAKELKALSKASLSKTQQNECEAVREALTRQIYSYKNINSILDNLLKKDLKDASFDIDKFTAFYLDIVAPDSKEYNPYYKGFREVLSTLLTDGRSGKLAALEDAAQYVNGLKSRL